MSLVRSIFLFSATSISVPHSASTAAFAGQSFAEDESPRRPVSQTPRVSTEPLLYRGFKWLFDTIGSLMLLVITAPILVCVALAVRLTSRGPVIYRQKRLTKSGKEFMLYKFRTMRANAEKNTGAVWAAQNDPRVTPVGTVLRATRLDELPQLFNVLKGDMSLIGPRPERPEFVSQICEELPGFRQRLKVKAGLTGLAQVRNGYSDSTEGHRKKLAWDRVYIRRRSILLDIWIALKTIPVVITGRGAR